MDEFERASILKEKRDERKKKKRELAQGTLADAGPGRLLAMAEAAGISSEQIAAVAQSVAPPQEKKAVLHPSEIDLPKGDSGGNGGGLGGLISGLMGGAGGNSASNPIAMAETATNVISGLVTTFCIVLAIILVATVFVIPRNFRVFWLFIISFSVLYAGGFKVYQEWANSASNENSDSYRSMARGLLTALTVIYTVSVLSILLLIIWKVIVIAKKKSDILGRQQMIEQGNDRNQFNRRPPHLRNKRDRHKVIVKTPIPEREVSLADEDIYM